MFQDKRLKVEIFFKHGQCTTSITNYFLVNLSVADLLVTLICMPNAAWRAYTDAYNFGAVSCKISAYLQGVSVASSIFTITTMAVDRYLAIIRPFGLRYKCFNKTTTVVTIFALWGLSLILFSPNLWIAELQPVAYGPDLAITLCRMEYDNSPIPQDVIAIVWFVFVFAVPGCIMTIAYSLMGKTLCSSLPPFDNNESACAQQRIRVMKSRKRVAGILLLLAMVFAACWLPYHIMSLLVNLAGAELDPNETVSVYLLLLGHANSALNPIIYCALSRNFRNSIKNLLKFKIRCRRRKTLNNWAADSSGSGFQGQAPHNKGLPLLKQYPNDFGISRRQSSQKTTKTCAV
ncbi:neuropeptide FF receptor 2-like isoform X2 [Anthonomus grandis grandis]|uniref:neuropeptide FF receptor 2-like isoform X2 n=1 Tax=Anthonomus grandis grandis TaxID=2921223 RepID=UPI002166839A|nr:neuropeptide FF receptor 2-like isoform X2 [Anthonomus grandis grandis]